jgi:very-short-patch-repair endonuclease
MVLKEKKTVFEINGPYHYIKGDVKKPVSTDRLNHAIIESFGYKIIPVSIDNFNQMPQEDKAKVY